MNTPIKSLVLSVFTACITAPASYADEINIGKNILTRNQIIEQYLPSAQPIASEDADTVNLDGTRSPGKTRTPTRSICSKDGVRLPVVNCETKTGKKIPPITGSEKKPEYSPVTKTTDQPTFTAESEHLEPSQSSCPESAISMEVLFEYNSDQLTPTAIAQLKPFGEALASEKLQGLSWRVEGHTDAIGGELYNKNLSLHRAETVKNFLKNQFSFAGKDINAIGKGKSQLADPENPSSEKNRRVRIIKTGC